ncbi:MAG: DUF2029 domain-containing protein [Sphingomicrobium sp.]
MLIVAVVGVPILVALIRPVSHDESQYVTATALTARGLLPYRDYAFLQTPLQPLLLAPLAWLFPGHLFLASRLANALLGSATLALVYAAARRAGASLGAARAATALLLCCHVFLWSTGVARNDMLPAALLAAALCLAIDPRGMVRPLAAGLCLGLAVAAKISYALPAAAMLLVLLKPAEGRLRQAPLLMIAGMAPGGLIVAALAAAAPQAFLFEVFTFGIRAPAQWNEQLGEQWKMGSLRFAYFLAIALVGPALCAMAWVASDGWRRRAVPGINANERLLLAAIVGGIVSALLNRPVNIPYLLPALPPLFVLLAMVLTRWQPRGWLLAPWAATTLAGIVPASLWLVHAVTAGASVPRAVEARAAVLGAMLRAHHASGDMASLSGELIADSGYPLDPRFAAGPFPFRTEGLVSERQAVEWRIVTRDQAAALRSGPLPGAFVSGIENKPQLNLDQPLTKDATELGFVAVGRVGEMILWLPRPRAPTVEPIKKP